MLKIARYTLLNLIRSKVIIAYTLLLFTLSFGFLSFEDEASKAISSLLSIVLIVIPLVCLVFTTSYFYNSNEFILLLMAQPISRSNIFWGLFIGISFSMTMAFLVGLGLPIVLLSPDPIGISLILAGVVLSLVFVSIALLSAIITRDKAKGIGRALMIWFLFSIVFDALVLGIVFSFSEYPLEKLMVVFASLNPIDLARIFVLLKMDISALMGMTGALYKQFFGSSFGMIFVLFVESIWIAIPLFAAHRVFLRRNW